jgi:hypothetical protein
MAKSFCANRYLRLSETEISLVSFSFSLFVSRSYLDEAQ